MLSKLLLGVIASAAAPAQEAVVPQGSGASPTDASIFTRRDARAITLAIPAPRGMILDRNGQPFAQTRVAWQLGLQYQQFEKADREFVVNWGRTRIEKAKTLLPGVVEPTDDELWSHYVDRRWLPLLVSTHIHKTEKDKIEPNLGSGLVLHPVYQRYYPESSLAAHIVGYTGSVGKLPTGPINFNEPLFEDTEGRSGLEYLYNRDLTGTPGMKKLLYDEHGHKFPEEQPKRPRPGGNVVTTLNLEWQKHAEKVLAQKVRRGAFVLIDVATGEVLVMASRPTFDLNEFVPGISAKRFKELEDDPGKPLFGRAFQSAYPPGSSFKPIVALTALDEGLVGPRDTVNCPASITIGGHTFNNHNRRAAGDLNVIQALASSNNIWFGKVGMRLGSNTFLDTARRFGFGSRTGLPLIGESAGNVPTNEWMLAVEKRTFKDGDAFNMSIGQGPLLVTPLQMAQSMAGIANGGVLPKLHLVTQVQDTYGRVVSQAIPERRNWLGIDEKAIETTRQGMRTVVTAGTGRSAGLSFADLCGKTGTAQWRIASKTNLAWFAGFMPYDNPRFAFAVVYEGRPNENPSGGSNAAPVVKSFFEPLKNEFKEIIAPAPKALQIIEETEEVQRAEEVTEEDIATAIPVPEAEEEEEAPRRPLDDEEEDAGPPVLRAGEVDLNEFEIPEGVD